MKIKNYAIFLIVSIIMPFVGQNTLYGMKKQNSQSKDKKTKEDFNAILAEEKKHQKQLKITQEKEQKQKLEDLKQQELKNNQLEQKLMAEYPLIIEFKNAYKKTSLTEKNTLAEYYSWLQEMKKINLEQDSALNIMLQYAEIQAKAEIADAEFFNAWGKYIEKLPNLKFKFSYPIEKTNNAEEFILGLRFINEIKAGHTACNFTDNEIFTLQTALLSKNENSRWLANAILKTNAFYESERLGGSFGKKDMKQTKHYKDLINALPISKSLKKQWFVKYALMDKLVIDNYAQSLNNTNNDQEFYTEMKKLFNQAQQQRLETVQVLDSELTKLEKILPPKKSSPPLIKQPIFTKKTQRHESFVIEELPKEEPLQFTDIITPKKEAEKSCTPQLAPVILKTTPVKPTFWKTIAPRVELWYSNPSQAFENLKIKYDKEIHEKYFQYTCKMHTFSDTVDYFIKPLAIQCSWTAQGARIGDISYNISGQIIDHDTGTETIGVFSYGVSKDGTLFHRCFSIREYEKISADIQKCVYDGLFPDLKDEQTYKQQTKLRLIKDFDSKNVKENAFYVEINDTENNMTIRLFKVKK